MEYGIVLIVGIMTFTMFWALYTTFTKEKLMIEQGEGSLPASTYSFIALRHITRISLQVLVLTNITEDFLAGFGLVSLFFLAIGVTFLVEIVSVIVETVVRTLYFKYQFRKMSEEGNQEE